MQLEYEAITPQTLLRFKVKSMTYGDELNLRSAILATDAGITEHFNQALWNSITSKPDEIKTYDDFRTKITIEDRSALVNAWYHATYGDEFTTETVCPRCGQTNQSLVRVTKHVTGNFYKGKPLEFLSKRKEVTLDDDVSFTLMPALLINEEKLVKGTMGMELSPGLNTILLHTEQARLKDKVMTLDDVIDLISLVKTIPAPWARKLRKVIDTEFERYKLEVPYKVVCGNPRCGYTYQRTLDFVAQFFSNVIEA